MLDEGGFRSGHVLALKNANLVITGVAEFGKIKNGQGEALGLGHGCALLPGNAECVCVC